VLWRRVSWTLTFVGVAGGGVWVVVCVVGGCGWGGGGGGVVWGGGGGGEKGEQQVSSEWICLQRPESCVVVKCAN